MAFARRYSEAEINQIFDSAQALTHAKQYDRAEEAFQIVLQTFPNHPHVLSSYSKLNTNIKNFAKAEKLIKAALKTAPNDIFVLLDLAIYYGEIEDYKGYVQALKKAISIEPLNLYATINLFSYHLAMCEYETLKKLLVHTQETHPRSLNDVMLKIMCAAIAYIENKIEDCEELLVATEYFASEESRALEKQFPQRQTLRVYQKYTRLLLEWRKENQNYYSETHPENIYVVGDSHSYGAANINTKTRTLKTKLVINTTAWLLVNGEKKLNLQIFRDQLKTIEKGSEVLLSFGEIDCRVNAGIHKHHLKNPQKILSDSVNELVTSYVELVTKYTKKYGHYIRLINCPAPLEEYVRTELSNDEEIEQYKTIPTMFNKTLAEQAAKHGIEIVDIYQATHEANGWSKANIHLDSVHLKPNILAELLK